MEARGACGSPRGPPSGVHKGVFIYIYIYMYIHICIYIYMYIHISLSIYIYIYILLRYLDTPAPGGDLLILSSSERK